MIPKNLVLLSTKNFTRIQDRLHIVDPALINLMSEVPPDHSFINFNDINNANWHLTLTNLGQQSFLHVVSETVFDYPHIFFSEKSVKPIIAQRPFVLLGSPGCLHNLKRLGFKTFNQYWDESYDTIVDPAERMLAVVDVIDFVCSKSITELQQMCVSMKNILDYNLNYYINEFQEKELEKFEANCKKNLGLR
jgi:hypothetical protein